MKFLFIRDLETEMRRQLVADMAAQLRLGEPFHSAKGCIKFEEPRSWNSCPIIQIDFCMVDEWPSIVSLILWIGRKPDEDDFYSQLWLIGSWNQLYSEAMGILDRKEADDE